MSTTVDVEHFACDKGSPHQEQGTIADSINPEGAIAGFYFDEGNVFHGFVRTREGTITTFDVPGAGTGAFQGTLADCVNPAGVIRGKLY